MAGLQPKLDLTESDTLLDIPSENVRPNVRETSPMPVTSPVGDGPGNRLRLSSESAFGVPAEDATATSQPTPGLLPPSPGTRTALETSKSRPNSMDTYQEVITSGQQKSNSPTKGSQKPGPTPFSRSLAVATASAPERLAEKMVERLQQSCLSEASLGKTYCIWEENLPGGSGSGKGFSLLVAQAFAVQVKAVGFSSVEWWGGKEFKDTGGKYLVNPIPMYDKYTVKLRVRWENEPPPPRILSQGRRRSSGEGSIVAMMKEVKDVLVLQKQLVLVAQAQARDAQRRVEQLEADARRWVPAPLGFSPGREADATRDAP